MNRVLLLISAIWVAMLLTPTVAAADAEIVLLEKEIDDDHIIIRRENGERLLLEKWSLRFSPLSFEGKTFVASVSPMWVTIYLEDRDEIKWSIEERLEAARSLHRTVPGTIQQPRRGAPAKTLDPTFILLVQGALSLLGLEPGPLNGVMAEQMRTAIREFQRREKLAADGVPGQATCLALATGLYLEAARVCLDRHHTSPTEFVVQYGTEAVGVLVEWDATDERSRGAWAKHIDTTEAGAYACALAAVELTEGLVAIRRAETGTGADYYIGPPDQPLDDLEGCLRLEVSGTDRGTASAVARRLREKIEQAAVGNSNLPAMAGVVGFYAQLIMLQLVEAP